MTEAAGRPREGLGLGLGLLKNKLSPNLARKKPGAPGLNMTGSGQAPGVSRVRVRVRVRVIEKKTKSERHPGRPVST